MGPNAVARVVRDALAAGATEMELLARIDDAALDLALAMDVLADPYAHLAESEAYEVEENVCDPLFALVEHCGVERAAEIVGRTTAWRNADVAAHYAAVVAWQRAEAAITDECSIDEVYDLVRAPEVAEHARTSLLNRIARVYSLDELAVLAARLTDDDASCVARVLRRSVSAVDGYEQLLLGDTDDAQLLTAMARFWSVDGPPGCDTETAVVAVYARVLRAALRPLARALSLASRRGPAAWWLPIFRAEGLRPSRAVLHLIEHDVAPLDAAALLAGAGYEDDEVLEALLVNGIGTRTSLALLRDGGWQVERTVEALARRRMLLPEVRTQLADLGVPPSAQRTMLVAHWEPALVDMVLGDDAAGGSVLRLSSGIEPRDGDD